MCWAATRCLRFEPGGCAHAEPDLERGVLFKHRPVENHERCELRGWPTIAPSSQGRERA